MKLNLFGKPILIDYDQFTILFDLAFVDENILQEVEDLINEGTFTKMVLSKSRSKRRITYEMQKKWFVNLSIILVFFKIIKNAQNINSLHQHCKKKYLPINMITVGNEEIITTKSLSYLASDDDALTAEELGKGLELMEDEYEQLYKIDFSDKRKVGII